MIPKVAYFYWGNETMSFLRYMTFKSFRYYHPDWEIKLVKRKIQRPPQRYKFGEKQDWMVELEDHSHKLDDLNIDMVYLEESYPEIACMDISDVHVSDLLGWKILAEKGGVVSDTDIIYLKPFDYEKYCSVDFGIVCFKEKPKENYMPVSFLIGQPNEAWKHVYSTARFVVRKHVYESAGTPALEKAIGHFTNIVEDYPDINIQRLPSKIVFPWAEDYLWRHYCQFAFKENRFDELHDDTIGIHWYAGATESQNFNRLYTENNYLDFDTTISAAIGACL